MREHAAAISQTWAKQDVRCPLCREETVMHAGEHGTGKHGDYRLCQCLNCDVQFWEPMKNPGGEWYEENKHSPYRAVQNRLGVKFELFLENSRVEGGKILDVGCGNGAFLKACRDRGYRATGIDFNRQAIRDARNLNGLEKVHALSLDKYKKKYPCEKFDVISFFEVIEHQDDPNSFMCSIRSLLVPDGYIVLSVPNRDRWSLLKKLDDDPPEHLTRWNLVSLRSFIESSGFSIIDLQEIPFSTETARLFITNRVLTAVKKRRNAGIKKSRQKQGTTEKYFIRYKWMYGLWRLLITPPSLLLTLYAKSRRKKESTIYCLARLTN